MKKLIKRNFYNRPTLEVAKDLLGCVLVREIGGNKLRGTITEVEAYVGIDDLASHASKGRTPRTEMMFGQAGHAYVYLVYGMHHCLNVVTGKKDFPAAVLIRSVAIDGIDKKKTNGPGKLCKVLEIDRTLNGTDMTSGKKLWIENGKRISADEIKSAPRVGVAYAKHCADYPWRFFIGE